MSIFLYVVTLMASVCSGVFLYSKNKHFQDYGNHTKLSLIGFMVSSLTFLFCVYWSTITGVNYDLFVVIGIYGVVFVILGPIVFIRLFK